jgi:AefR-like transcriptional repressor, C-terminal domain
MHINPQFAAMLARGMAVGPRRNGVYGGWTHAGNSRVFVRLPTELKERSENASNSASGNGQMPELEVTPIVLVHGLSSRARPLQALPQQGGRARGGVRATRRRARGDQLRDRADALGDLRAELTLLARSSLQLLARERSLRRIVITEGDRFPDLKRRFKTGIVDRAYREATGFVRQKMETGEFPEGDAEAIAVAMLGSLLAYEFEIDVFGRPPAGVDEERLIGSVVDSWMAMARDGRKREMEMG